MEAMAKEWSVYKEFKATDKLKQHELGSIMKRGGRPPQIIDARWVLTRKGSGLKTRLVAIGCQEKKTAIKTDRGGRRVLRVGTAAAVMTTPASGVGIR